MRGRVNDQALIRGYVRLNGKMDALHREVRQLIHLLMTPAHISPDLRSLLLQLPSSLLKTYFALQELGEGSAADVAAVTGKARAVESSYLCQLARLGLCGRRKTGRHILFTMHGKGGEHK